MPLLPVARLDGVAVRDRVQERFLVLQEGLDELEAVREALRVPAPSLPVVFVDRVVVELVPDLGVVLEAVRGEVDGLDDEVVVVYEPELVNRGGLVPESFLPAGAHAEADGFEADADPQRGADFPELAFGHGAVDNQKLQTFELLLGQPSRFESEVEAVVVVVRKVHGGKDPVAGPIEFGQVSVLEEKAPAGRLRPILMTTSSRDSARF